MIASHYAEPAERWVQEPASLRGSGSADGELVRELQPGERFLMLDDSLGWAWGYAGDAARVGYVPSEALGRQPRTDA